MVSLSALAVFRLTTRSNLVGCSTGRSSGLMPRRNLDFVRFHLFLVEDLAHCALGEVGEARMSLRGSMLASVAGQKPRCPQFVGIPKFLRLPARHRHQPCLGLVSDRRLS